MIIVNCNCVVMMGAVNQPILLVHTQTVSGLWFFFFFSLHLSFLCLTAAAERFLHSSTLVNHATWVDFIGTLSEVGICWD